MCERRSSRQRRTVDYRQFADRGSDDDDFESSSVPRKKTRLQQPGRDGTAVRAEIDPQHKEQVSAARPSRDERRFNRDTEKALRHSEAVASGSSGAEQPSPSPPACGGDSARDGKDGDYKPEEDGNEKEEEEEFLSGAEGSSDDDFSVSSPPRKKTKTATAKPTASKTKRAMKSETEPTEKGRGRGRAGREQASSDKPAKVVRRTKQNSARPPSQAPPPLSSHNVRSPLANTPGLGIRRMPKWTPPGASGRENVQHSKCVMSGGGTPVVRVGLSRNARVKPLHNSCH